MRRYGGVLVWVVGEQVLGYPPDLFQLNGKDIWLLTNRLKELNP